MLALFEAVLTQRNLSKVRIKNPKMSEFIVENLWICFQAGDLFSVEDVYIIQDLPQVLPAIREIISALDFLVNHNDQSLVEICITRVTSAIRETNSIEKFADALVDLLETCLNYNLRPVNGGPDPPHAKIASDVMSCIFLVRSSLSFLFVLRCKKVLTSSLTFHILCVNKKKILVKLMWCTK